MIESDLKNLVRFTEASIPAMQHNWAKQIKEGYQARLKDEPRRTHHARRRGAWFRGWDMADTRMKDV